MSDNLRRLKQMRKYSLTSPYHASLISKIPTEHSPLKLNYFGRVFQQIRGVRYSLKKKKPLYLLDGRSREEEEMHQELGETSLISF